MKAYYNEHDPKAAAWLRELIKQGHIADGDVDERSIEDVVPNELAGYTQCHFFAGIGVWSYSLRRAGWPDDRPVWTGSCPCQPFSAAGKAGGFDDERHLWPAFFHLVQQCRPATIFGEQVASKDGLAWLQLVHLDLEGTGYSVGALDLCAAGFGAPHIRQRIFFVADADGAEQHPQREGQARAANIGAEPRREQSRASRYSESRQLAHPLHAGRPEWRPESGSGSAAGGGVSSVALGDTEPTRLEGHGGDVGNGNQPGRHGAHTAGSVAEAGAVNGLADAASERQRADEPGRDSGDGIVLARTEPGRDGGDNGPVNGFWHPADWLPCRDGKWRPVEPGTFPLAHGAPARVGRLRGYGNAIVAPVAQGFIEAYLGVTS